MRRRLTALEEPGGLAHGRLDVEDLDVLPVLLEERDEEVDGELHVIDELLLGHSAVADGDVEAEHLLKLELDHRLHLVHLGAELLRGQHDRGELARLVQAGAEQTRNLLDQRLRGEEDLVLLRELLDELLVLVERLQSVGILEVKAQAGGLLAMEGVAWRGVGLASGLEMGLRLGLGLGLGLQDEMEVRVEARVWGQG